METLLDVGVDVLLPQFYSQILDAIDEIQALQKPPYSDGALWIEVRQEWRKRPNGLLLTVLPLLFDPLFCRVMRLDGIFINQDGTKYSVKKLTTVTQDPKSGKSITDEYFPYSEGIMAKFPGYKLDSANIVMNVSDRTIDLEEHIEFLSSNAAKDLLLYRQIIKEGSLFGTQARFLSGKPQAAISYTSYPRSGNTFLRKYLENITGIATGSDQLMKFSLNVELQYSGFKGEGIVKERCWINKTHFPFRTPMDHQYDTQVVLLAVRNPLDVFVSFFHMIGTQSHTKSFREDLYAPNVKEFWCQWFDSELECYFRWHEYWMDQVRNSNVPIYFFRFEDLLLTPEVVLKDMFKFILAKEDVDNSVIEQRIKDVISTGKNFLYKPRSAGGGFNKHANKITKDQMDRLKDKLEYYLYLFGYAKNDDYPESDKLYSSKGINKYEFYDFGGKEKPENKSAYMDFVKINEKMLQMRLNQKKTGTVSKMPINGKGDGFSMLVTKKVTSYSELLDHTSIRD